MGQKKGSGVYCLYGELGAGKTTFVQGFAKGIGVKDRIISPTFILVRTHGKFYHIDLYRTKSLRDAQLIGLEEIMEDATNIVLIEWPEKAEKILPKDRTEIRFSYVNEQVRKIIITEKG